MTGTPEWTVAFAGPGFVTEQDAEAQLNNWWKEVPKETEFTLILPARIARAQKGLHNVAAYLTKEFGDKSNDGFETSSVGDIVGRLKDASDAGHEAYLVLLWGDEGDTVAEDLLEAATQASIKVLDLTTGLEPLAWEETGAQDPPDEPETPAKAPAARRRRGSTPPAEEAVTDAPRKTRGKPRAAAAKVYDVATGVNEADPTEPVDLAFTEITLTAEKIADIVADAMKQSWVTVFTLILEALKAEPPRKPGRPPGAKNKPKDV